jgi:tRNA U54 and U55 pseudouridine synthase Pus10
LTIKSAKKEKNTNEDLDVVAADLKKYDCFVCDKKFRFQHSRRKHIRKFHKNACHICGSTFQTIQETAKHISGNLKKLHDFSLQGP